MIFDKKGELYEMQIFDNYKTSALQQISLYEVKEAHFYYLSTDGKFKIYLIQR